MQVTAWTNGDPNPYTGSGYGIRIKKADRDVYFSRMRPHIKIHLRGGPTIEVKLSDSFWRGCSEIRKKEIGLWIINQLKKRGQKWVKGKPPKFNLIPISANEFELTP